MNNIIIESNIENYIGDLTEMIRAFDICSDSNDINADKITVNFEKSEFDIKIIINYDIFYNKTSDNAQHLADVVCDRVICGEDALKDFAKAKRLAKLKIYEILSSLTGITLPYGSLTGIRPTKLYRESNRNAEYFEKTLHVSKEKTKLIDSIVKEQSGLYVCNDKLVDIFINVPFCTTRCSYCSFISAEIGKVKKYIPSYVSDVIKEIRDVKRWINDLEYKVRAVYIGGGTPTSLDTESLESILKECDFENEEFTVEAGRPDTITRDKLEIMKKHGVTRVSVNPQSFNDKTLAAIGRNHSVEDILRVYREAKTYGFIINMDLIAMLPDEDLADFKYSVDKAIELDPHNITVHTLSLKRGSKLRESSYERDMSALAGEMIGYSAVSLKKAGYKPYYMYRQKYMSGNLENTGYAKDNTACLYNIDIMEESLSIVANGAGGISKRLYVNENRLERLANPKGIDVYLDRIDAIIENKRKFFS